MRTPPPILDDVEELQLSLVKMQQEKEAWKTKYQTLEVSYSTKLKEKDDLIEILESHVMEMMEKEEDLFSSRAQPGPSHSFSNSGNWKEVADKYAEEKKQLKDQIIRLVGKCQCVERSSSALAP